MTESEYVRRLIADGVTEAPDRDAIHQSACVTEALLEKVAFVEDIVARIGASQDPEFVAEARERAQAYARSTCRAA